MEAQQSQNGPIVLPTPPAGMGFLPVECFATQAG